MASRFNPKKWLEPARDAGSSPFRSNHKMNDSDILDKVEKVVSMIEHYQIDITLERSVWIKLGYAFANELGENGRDFYHRVCQFYLGYSYNDCDNQYNECISTADGRSGIGTFFYYAKMYNISFKDY